MATYKVPVIPGDGVGPEVISEGKKVIDTVSEVDSFEVNWIEYPFGSDHYLTTGELINENSLKELKQYRSIYLGALGDPRVTPGVLELGILLKLRFYMDEYINLRPVKLFEGVPTPLQGKTEKDVNFTVIRENTEDFYIGIGSKINKGKSKEVHNLFRELYTIKFNLDIETDTDEIAYQIGVISQKGAERVIKYAFDLATKTNQNKVTSVDKANVLTHSYGLWRKVFSQISTNYSDIETESIFVDAAAMWFVKNPEWFKVIVTPNLFGDILTDLGAIIQGGLGVAPGGNINPGGTSTFEPIHGSAPKYKGKEQINPIATILAGSMLLDNLGLNKSANKIEEAVKQVLREGKVKTPDLGGRSKTSEVSEAVISNIRNS